ncbi:hypothetical protein BHE74_00043238 [Ensete ventricosum]|nr:hypothetical protein BHE74_00043238 [Ensete ventricosum]
MSLWPAGGWATRRGAEEAGTGGRWSAGRTDEGSPLRRREPGRDVFPPSLPAFAALKTADIVDDRTPTTRYEGADWVAQNINGKEDRRSVASIGGTAKGWSEIACVLEITRIYSSSTCASLVIPLTARRMRLRSRLVDEICCFNCSLKAAVLRKYRSWATRRHGGSEKNMCGDRGGRFFSPSAP